MADNGKPSAERRRDAEPEQLPSEAAEPSRPEPGEAADKRRIPDGVRRNLVRLPSGRLYLPAAQRLVWFRDEKPEWEIHTELIEGGQEAGYANVKATIRTPEGRVIATSMKTETKADFPAGWVEKAETGAIGRALAVAGYGTQFAMDMEDEAAQADARPMGRAGDRGRDREASADRLWPGPGQCPQCHAPEGKPHGKRCPQQ